MMINRYFCEIIPKIVFSTNERIMFISYDFLYDANSNKRGDRIIFRRMILKLRRQRDFIQVEEQRE